jgi:hypothetical protein
MGKNKYQTHIEPRLDEIEKWREEGYTEKQIAKLLGIGYTTFRTHKYKNTALTTILDKATPNLGRKLKYSSYEEALGYYKDEITEEIEVNPRFDGEPKKKVKKVRKWFRGSPQLLIFHLCNMFPEKFKRVDKEAVRELQDEIDKHFEFNNEKMERAFEIIQGDALKDKKERDSGKKGDILDEPNS